MAFSSAYHDSDADDEYERSIMTSPHLATDDETSPTDSDPPSTEPTPTTFAHSMDYRSQVSPSNTIEGWTVKQCAEYISNLGLSQYCDKLVENEVNGEALIALRHEELKEMGIVSMGHRLIILKAVYEIKIKQGIPIDPDLWVPISEDAGTATQADISRIIKSMDLRDQKILSLEASLRSLNNEYQKLREDVIRLKPLPHPGSQSPEHMIDGERSPYGPTSQPSDQSKGLSRKFSTKRLFLGGSTPKSSSPTHAFPQSTFAEGKRTIADTSILDPSPAAIAAINHLGQPSPSPSQPSIPSPTSPYGTNPSLLSGARSGHAQSNTISAYSTDRPSNTPNPNARPQPARPYQPTSTIRDDEPPPSAGGASTSGGPSVEIFKSFRVSMEDPCEKVLPAALKKYNINADWKNYALYIVYGDQERCLGLKEKPLILFKQLDKEGRKPMFMLRRHAAPMEGHSGPSGGGGAGGFVRGGGYDQLGSGTGSSIQLPQLPGGVL